MTVWCSMTWLRTLPREYLVSSRVAASSTASLMAMPSEPGLSGSAARMARPACVWSLGLDTQVAPHACIIRRRYGFCS
jgi:hypothetical protein